MSSDTMTDNRGENRGVLVPQPHGGALRQGQSNKGGHGRRPDRIKKLAQQALLPRVKLLGHLADGVAIHFDEDGGTKLLSPTPGERIRAIEALHKIGMGDTVSVADVKERLRTQLRVIRDLPDFTDDQKSALVRALGAVWR